MYAWLNSLVNKNKSEFAQWSAINWLNPYAASDFEAQRDVMLRALDNMALFNGTKPYYEQISKGCSICGEGQWSCLFITNKCNARCFYCPVPQNEDELPSTQGLDFSNSHDYAAYVKHFDFKGVSFSGGEPLLFFDRTKDYLQAVRQHCSDEVYVWMYTNGLLAAKDKLEQLAGNGLDEIRFDIGATGFSLDKVRMAKGLIPHVTIEIPAVPEEKDKLIAMLPDMVAAGVTNLNLHQLRLTPHNADKLVKRGYTIVNAERPLVLESELAALEIIHAAQAQGLPMGINYCSFHYKHRFQKAGYRRMVAQKAYPDAAITSTGYIREYTGDTITYRSIKLVAERDDLPNAKRITVEGNAYVYVESTVFRQEGLSGEEQRRIEELIANEPVSAPVDHLLFNIWQCEYIERGLREYY